MEFTIQRPDHFSPSTINSFIAYRAQWFINKILGKRSDGNPAMFRGSAVEDGVNHFIEHRYKWTAEIANDDKGLMINSCKVAEESFKRRCAEIKESPSQLIDSIGTCVMQALFEFICIWRDQKPVSQHKITTRLNGVKTPVIGYLDYLLHNQVDDLKVTATTPSSLKQDYQIQGSIYRHATGLPVNFFFVVPLKTKTNFVKITLDDTDYRWALDYATMAAQRMELIYDIMEKPHMFQKPGDIAEVFAAMSFPDLSSFWTEKDHDFVSTIWNIKQRGYKANPFVMPNL